MGTGPCGSEMSSPARFSLLVPEFDLAEAGIAQHLADQIAVFGAQWRVGRADQGARLVEHIAAIPEDLAQGMGQRMFEARGIGDQVRMAALCVFAYYIAVCLID